MSMGAMRSSGCSRGSLNCEGLEGENENIVSHCKCPCTSAKIEGIGLLKMKR
jgi:hypothetical protein